MSSQSSTIPWFLKLCKLVLQKQDPQDPTRLRDPRKSEEKEKGMTIDRFETPGLAQYSYIICSQGRSVVIDPIRDTDRYLQFLQERGLTLSYIVETHIHADFASGAKALAEATGAELSLSAYDEGEHYRYGMLTARSAPVCGTVDGQA